jgi:hypothetical protein
LTDLGTFRISKNYINTLVFSLELNEGKIKTKSATSNLLDGHTLDYKFSEDEKEQIESFIFFNITPKKEFINIKTEVKLKPENRTFIHNRKEPITLYVNKNLLDAEEKSTFTGGIWKQNQIFFKKRSNSTQPITTKTFKSQKNQIKINLDDTYGLKVEKFGSNLRVDFFVFESSKKSTLRFDPNFSTFKP